MQPSGPAPEECSLGPGFTANTPQGTTTQTFCEVGGVPYVLEMEGKQDQATWGDGVDYVTSQTNQSFLCAAHAFRMANKPYLYQDPDMDQRRASNYATFTTSEPVETTEWVRKNLTTGSGYFHEHPSALHAKSGVHRAADLSNTRY